MNSGYKVLLIGNGSREHAISKKLSESNKVEKIFVAPGNGGTLNSKNPKIVNLDKLDLKKNETVLSWCLENKPNLIVIGPEDPLNLGLTDLLLKHKFEVFGPTQLASQIECDKGFAKDFMLRNKIPTAEYKLFNDAKKALDFLDNPTFENPLVIKATGLALGKGVVVAKSIDEAKNAVKEMLISKKFGSSSETIVIEQFLEGDEFSALAFTDGKTIRLLPTAQDHKRAYFKDQGPNTGGMGAISPFPLLNKEKYAQLEKLIKDTIVGLEKENRFFVGCLFAGLMLTNDGKLKVLEFNCRFGDPETQTILHLLKNDLFEIFLSCAKITSEKLNINGLSTYVPYLKDIEISFKNYNCVSYVIASGGYPETSTKNLEIRGLEKITKKQNERFSIEIFHAATYFKDNKYYTNGGRLFSVVFYGNIPLTDLLKESEPIVNECIDIDSFFYRPDIGLKTARKLVLQQNL